METYREYTIRCKSCNEQIACFSLDYEAMLEAGSSVEEALNNLGIYNPCSRAAMMNPTIVSFNMENREVIEGFKSVDAATDADAQNESTTRPIFVQCMGIQPTLALGIMGVQTVPVTAPQLTGRAAPALVGTRTLTTAPLPPVTPAGRVAAIPIQPIAQPAARTLTTIQPIRTLTTIQQIQPARTLATIQPARTLATIQPLGQGALTTLPGQEAIVPPIIPGIDLDDIEALGAGIPVKGLDVTEPTKFQEPVAVGVPTINSDPMIPRERIYVGANKYVEVLNGRTHLAQ